MRDPRAIRASQSSTIPQMEQTRITHEGSPEFASLLVHYLEQEGASVEWTPPMERRGGRPTEQVVVQIVAWGTIEMMRVAVRKFLEKFPRAKVRIEDDDEREDDD